MSKSTLDAFKERQARVVELGLKAGDGNWNLQRIAEPAMLALDAAGVPRPDLRLGGEELSGGLGAAFFVKDWAITAARPFYIRQAAPGADISRRAAGFYHEARHAEQFFLGAIVVTRMWKWSRAASEQILEEDLPQSVKDAARESALRPAEENRNEIAGWINAYPGVARIMTDLTGARAGLIALAKTIMEWRRELVKPFADQDDCARHTTILRTRQQRARLMKETYEEALAAYVGQAHEVDAYRLSGPLGWGAPSPETLYDRTVGPELAAAGALVDTGIRQYLEEHPPPPPADYPEDPAAPPA